MNYPLNGNNSFGGYYAGLSRSDVWLSSPGIRLILSLNNIKIANSVKILWPP